MKNRKAVALSAALLVLTMLFTACAGSGFDYDDDMSPYVTLDAAKYTNAAITVGKEPVVDAELIGQQIGKNASSAWSFDAASKSDKYVKGEAMTDHALAFIRYYGVTTEDGKPFAGGSSIASEKPTALLLGSGTFVEGFEEQLVGLKPSDTSYSSDKVTLTGSEIVYITAKASYTVPAATEGGKDTTTSYNDYTFTDRRVDLSADSDPLAVLFRDAAKTNGVGKEFKVTDKVQIDGTERTVNITATVKYVVKDKAISVKFPDDYHQETLQGKYATFFVTVDGYLPFATVAEKLGDDGKAFTVAAGEDLYTKYAEKVKKTLEENYAANIVANRRNAIWDYLQANAKVEAPLDLLAAYYAEAEENLRYTYKHGTLYGSIPYSSIYESFEKMVIAQLGGTDWQKELNKKCEKEICERILLHYMADVLKVSVSDAEIDAALKKQADLGYDLEDFEEAVGESLLWEKVTEKLDNAAYITVTEAK